MCLRSIRLILVSVAASLLLVVMCAPAAQAAIFHAASVPTALSGSQIEKIVISVPGAGNVECEEAKFSGSLASATSEEIELTSVFAKCKAFGFATAHINMTGCSWKLTWTTTLHLLCPAGAGIDITPTFLGSSVCTVKITPFTRNVAGIVTTVVLKRYLHVLLNLASLPVDAGCGGSTGENATMSGKFDIQASTGDLWYE